MFAEQTFQYIQACCVKNVFNKDSKFYRLFLYFALWTNVFMWQCNFLTYIYIYRNFPRDVPWAAPLLADSILHNKMFSFSLLTHFSFAQIAYIYLYSIYHIFPQNVLKLMMLTFLWLNLYFSGDQLRYPQVSHWYVFAACFQFQRCFTAFEGAFVFLKQITSKLRENINTVSFRRLGKKCQFFFIHWEKKGDAKAPHWFVYPHQWSLFR